MRVILLKDIKNLGRKHEVKHVSDGYARNFLVPRNMARLASQDALDELDEELRKREMLATEELEATQGTAEELDGLDVYVLVKADETGTVYGGVSAKTIQKALEEMGVAVDEKTIQIPEPIKGVGEYQVTVELEHGIEAEIKVIVEAEGV
ncbi:MAG: 50S ribosomal protein L9 [Candidatus Spechtbacterales bacterium]